jgi:hypothetical protein
VCPQREEQGGGRGRWGLNEFHGQALRVRNLEPLTAIRAFAHGLGHDDFLGRQIAAHAFGIGGIEGDVIRPVQSGSGGQRQDLDELRRREIIAHALRIFRIGHFHRAQIVNVKLLGLGGIAGIDRQMRYRSDGRPHLSSDGASATTNDRQDQKH